MTGESPLEDVSTDSLLEVLASDLRRHSLRSVAEASRPLTLDDLAFEVTKRDSAVSVEDADAIDTARLRLHHVHLPKLEEHGLVRYDQEGSHVHATDRTASVHRLMPEVDSVLESAGTPERSNRWR